MRAPGERQAAEERGAVAAAAPVRAAALQRLAATIGNAAFAEIARDGAGLLAGGAVHPAVERAIAARRGGGSGLDPDARARFGAALESSFDDVRVHTDDAADVLARSVSARAFTTGTDVYFARGEYRPGTGDGDRLIAHELTHVVQQRGAPVGGPLTVSDPADAFEAEADAVARELAGG